MNGVRLRTALIGFAGGSLVVVATLAAELAARGLPLRGGLIALQAHSVAVWVLESLPLLLAAAGWMLASPRPSLPAPPVTGSAPSAPPPSAQVPPPVPALPPPSFAPPIPEDLARVSANPGPERAFAPPPPPVPTGLRSVAPVAAGSPTADEGRLRALQELVRTLKEQAERSASESRSKSAYLANMSHELRTPLNAIIGYAEMLQEEASDQSLPLTDDLAKIADAGRQLVELVNHVLDLSKIEVGQLSVVLEDVDLAQVVDEVRVVVTPLAHASGDQFGVRIAPGARMVRADHLRVRQVLVNLLGNAFKFTRNGSVTLTIERSTPKRDAWIAIRVKDTGIGLTPEQAESIFDEYKQAERMVEKDFGGTGLGLAICRKLVELMGGRIELESAPGVGSTFSVILPPAQVHEEQVAPRSTIALNERLAGLHLLQVDADPGAVPLSRYLTRAGLDAELVRDAESAKLASRANAPDIVIVDVGVPGTWPLIEDLVADGVKVVVTSIRDEDVERALDLGTTAFLVRPLERKLVLATLERCIG